MSPDYGPEPEFFSDFVPTCRWNDNCELLMVRDGCTACDFKRPMSRNEDGDPYPSDSLEETPEQLP